jgi:undecaprenyl-diphosphatase
VTIPTQYRKWLKTSVVLFGAFFALAFALHEHRLVSFDSHIFNFFIRRRSTAVNDLAKVVSELGGSVACFVLGAVGSIVLWKRKIERHIALVPWISACAGMASAGVMKQVFSRDRPPVILHLVTETNSSFPSGHATYSSAFYLGLVLVALHLFAKTQQHRRQVIAVGVVAAVAVGLSRLVLGVHWPTDILAGWLLGLASTCVVWMCSLWLGEKDAKKAH